MLYPKAHHTKKANHTKMATTKARAMTKEKAKAKAQDCLIHTHAPFATNQEKYLENHTQPNIAG